MDIKKRARLSLALGATLQVLVIMAFVMLCNGKFEVNSVNTGILMFMVFSLVSGNMLDLYKRFRNLM